MKLLLVMDSRGRGLQKEIYSRTNETFYLDYTPGAGLKKLFNRSLELLDQHYYDTVCINGGICDITHRDSRSKGIVLPPGDDEHYVMKLQTRIEHGVSLINQIYPQTNIIILPIFGIDINQYNKIPGTSEDQQRLNHVIIAVNRMITVNNNSRNTATPTVASTIHCCKGRKRWSHRYKYLYDGCHMAKQARQSYAIQLLKSLGIEKQGDIKNQEASGINP